MAATNAQRRPQYRPAYEPLRQPNRVERRRGIARREQKGLTSKARLRLMLLVLVVGLIVLGLIVASAFAASINYQNNILREDNAALQSEVQSLESQVESTGNTAVIEKTATADLGMVYPTGKRLVKVSSSGADVEKADLSDKLKANAF